MAKNDITKSKSNFRELQQQQPTVRVSLPNKSKHLFE